MKSNISKTVWMDRDKTAKTVEIRDIQREDVVYTVDVHCGGQSGIVNLNAQDAVLHDNSAPLSIDPSLSGKKIMPASIACTSRAASATVKPKPLRSRGRVMAFQTPAIF
jgi:hypothetical protein